MDQMDEFLLNTLKWGRRSRSRNRKAVRIGISEYRKEGVVGVIIRFRNGSKDLYYPPPSICGIISLSESYLCIAHQCTIPNLPSGPDHVSLLNTVPYWIRCCMIHFNLRFFFLYKKENWHQHQIGEGKEEEERGEKKSCFCCCIHSVDSETETRHHEAPRSAAALNW